MRFDVVRDYYSATLGRFRAGDQADLSVADAAFAIKDSPGTFVPVESPAYAPEPVEVPEGKVPDRRYKSGFKRA